MEDLEQYIKIVKKEIEQYMQMIFEDGYDKEIFEQFLEDYINIRYFNIKQNINAKKDLYNCVMFQLDETAEKMLKIYNQNEVLNIKEIFNNIIYLDNIGKREKTENIINKIVEFRKEKLNIEPNTIFLKKISKEIENRKQIKDNYIKKFEQEEFRLRNKKTSKKNVQLTELTQNVVFPSSISTKIIKKVFNTGVTAEDKLIIEYHMLNSNIIQDIIKGEFYKEYIAEFSVSLLNKKNKLSRILKIVSDEFQKERIIFLIEYKNFTKDNKNDIYDLLRKGYKIAIKLDETFEFEESDIKKLDVFSYIIIDNELYYEKIENYNELSEKILKI